MMIKKALFILLILAAFSQPGLAFSPLSLDDFAVFADSQVSLDEIASSAGYVGSNGNIDIEKGNSGPLTGDLRARGRIRNQGVLTVYGNVITRHRIYDKGKLTVSGQKIERANLPYYKLPSVSFPASTYKKDPPFYSFKHLPRGLYGKFEWNRLTIFKGCLTGDTRYGWYYRFARPYRYHPPHRRATDKTLDIDVPKGGLKELPPGSYGTVEVNRGATLALVSGAYYMETLDTEESATIKANAARGKVIVTIRDRLDIDRDVAVKISGGTTRDVTFQFSGSREVDIESGAFVRGSLIAPRAEVEFDKGSRLHGAVVARKVEFEKGAAFMPHQPPVSLPPIAHAGADRSVAVGASVRLDGSRSTGHDLTYKWTWIARPDGSQAAFSDDTSVRPEFLADIAGTYTAELVVGQGDEVSDPDTVTITALAYLADLDEFAIYTQVEISLDEIAGITGNVGTNGQVKVRRGPSGMIDGDLQSKGEIEVDGTITVTGDVITNRRINGRSRITVLGTIDEKAVLPSIPLPVISHKFNYSAPSVEVDRDNSLQLEPGSYRKVDVDEDASLFMAAGEYTIVEFETGDRATIFIQGPVQVHIRRDLDVDDYVEFTLAEGLSTRDVKFYVYDNRVEFDAHAVMRGILVAPRANMTFKPDSQLHGAVYARKIKLQKRAAIHGRGRSAPEASDDAAEVYTTKSVVIDVLENDTDADGDSLSISETTQGEHGSVGINPDNTVTYTPHADYTGPDSFEYTVSDSQDGTDTAAVKITVMPLPDPPQIESFSAEPLLIQHGEASKLTWVTQGADSASIAPEVGSVPTSGSLSVQPTQTTRYVLQAENAGGTATAELTVSLPTPKIVIDGAQKTPDGNYTMVVGPTPPYGISGTYDLLTGDVALTATSGSATVNAMTSDGHFTLDLPAPGDWQITITEKTGMMRGGSTTLKLIVDDQPPSLTVFGPDEQTTAEYHLVVSGEAVDEGTGLDTVTVSSDRYAEHTFGASVDSMGGFTCEVPLRPGENQLSVVARDRVGNQSQKTILATAVLTGLPVITITSPAPGTIVLEPKVSVAGTVRSSLPPDQIRLVLGDRIQFPTGANGEYDFVFEDVALTPGSNTIQVTAETVYGSVAAQTNVFYRESEPGDEEILPTIEIRSPLPGSYLNTAAVIVSGTAQSELGIKQVTVNGDPAQVTGAGGYVSFEALLAFADENSVQLDIVVAATGGNDKTTTVKMTVYFDAQAPAIQITSADIVPAPAVNAVTQTPYPLTGTVIDSNLAGVTLNGQSIQLVPGADADTYNFEIRLMLARDQELPITIEAWDHAGNRTGYELILRLDAALDIEVIAPRDGTTLIASADTLDVDVTIRVPGIADGDQVRVRIDELPAVTLDRAGTVANGTITVAATDGDHKLAAEVIDAAGTVLARRTSGFSIVNTANVTLKLERLEPANNATGVETNEFVALYFNKPVDPQLLQVQVFETAHGLSYAAPEKGADITALSEIKLVEVHRDHEPVPGGVSHFPGNTMTAFYPQRDFAYGATIYVNVIYDSQELARASFSTRPLPTFIQGFVADQFKAPIAGIEVEIKELGRKAVTDSNGSYGFGFGDTADETISSGRYRAVVNPDLRNRTFGTAERWINVEGGRFNSAGMTLLPVLNPAEPFRHISSGQETALLANGDLVLNLRETTLHFPDGRDQGDVHVQFMELDQIAYPFLPSATPNWAFAIQPMGVEVSGPVTVTITMPPLFGSHDYVAQIGQRVILIGYDPEAMQIVPVGVGLVDADNHKVTSEGDVALERLDYLGYALVDTENQEILERFANGEISLRQMIGELESK